MDRFIFGDLRIDLDCGDFSLEQDNLIEPFFIPSDLEAGDIQFQLHPMDPSIFYRAECLRKTGGFELLRLKDGLFLMNHWAQLRFGYGLWIDDLKLNEPVRIWINPKMKGQHPLAVTRFFSTVGLHSKLLQKRAPVLHASYIDFGGCGLIFTAPSGTGKSTQADLWKKYTGAQIINGDRVLLRKIENKWHAFGYPCCGSSLICVNRTLPLAAIVVLAQGPDNQVELLTPAQKIRALVSATELYPWDRQELDLAFSLTEEIISQVPVLKLSSRPDAEAVEVLRDYLEENGYANCI